MIGEDNILTLTYHDFTTSWCMKINLYEVFCGIEYRELPDYEPDPDEVKITRWQRIKKIIQLIKKHHLDKELSEFKSWVESQKAEAESLRAKYKAGSDGYKSLTKRITLYNRASKGGGEMIQSDKLKKIIAEVKEESLPCNNPLK